MAQWLGQAYEAVEMAAVARARATVATAPVAAAPVADRVEPS